jgi:hypothetical protein
MKKERGLSRVPQRINDNNWYYEVRGGIEIVSYAKENMLTPRVLLIPWKKILKSVERYRESKDDNSIAKRDKALEATIKRYGEYIIEED